LKAVQTLLVTRPGSDPSLSQIIGVRWNGVLGKIALSSVDMGASVAVAMISGVASSCVLNVDTAEIDDGV
jgi:hypothetical protein